jgi:hypothetical protein
LSPKRLSPAWSVRASSISPKVFKLAKV